MNVEFEDSLLYYRIPPVIQPHLGHQRIGRGCLFSLEERITIVPGNWAVKHMKRCVSQKTAINSQYQATCEPIQEKSLDGVDGHPGRFSSAMLPVRSPVWVAVFRRTSSDVSRERWLQGEHFFKHL
ncbi:hypothetical protein TNIN_382741 [Trichonephila inaurata madagascariensis]|uniref:Uncharacterized protein n=1 Tax=Trichonephila inaurata madagascariensis TaxID=2747483 RepID=A0A8X7C6B3_9ARAC|nr:hypothetical protein TNIN_382741 [Trichonephila inaurata madagascariensis]